MLTVEKACRGLEVAFGNDLFSVQRDGVRRLGALISPSAEFIEIGDIRSSFILAQVPIYAPHANWKIRLEQKAGQPDIKSFVENSWGFYEGLDEYPKTYCTEVLTDQKEIDRRVTTMLSGCVAIKAELASPLVRSLTNADDPSELRRLEAAALADSSMHIAVIDEVMLDQWRALEI